MKDKLNEVATLLGGTLMPGHSPTTWFIVIGHPSDWKSLKLIAYHPYSKPDNVVHIDTSTMPQWWEGDQLKQNNDYMYYEGKNLGINVNITRPVEALAKDIYKRLVVPAKEANDKNVAAAQSSMNYKAKVLAFGREFGAMGDNDCKVRVFASADYSSIVELSYIGDSHAALRAELSHDKVRKVISFIKELVND